MSLKQYIELLTPDELAEYEAELAHDELIAERLYQELLKEQRTAYQLRQIGIQTERRFKADLSLPF